MFEDPSKRQDGFAAALKSVAWHRFVAQRVAVGLIVLFRKLGAAMTEVRRETGRNNRKTDVIFSTDLASCIPTRSRFLVCIKANIATCTSSSKSVRFNGKQLRSYGHGQCRSASSHMAIEHDDVVVAERLQDLVQQ